MKERIAEFLHDYIEKNAPARVRGMLGEKAIGVLTSIGVDLLKLFSKEDHTYLKNIVHNLPTAEGVPTPYDFMQRVVETKGLQYSVTGQEFLDNSTNPGIIVANHPTGALDGITLLHYLHDRGIKAKIVMNSINSFMDPNGEVILPVCNKKNFKREEFYTSVKEAIKDGYFVIIFPAGNEAVYNYQTNQLEELPWSGLAAVTLSSMHEISLYPVNVSFESSSLPALMKNKKRGMDTLQIFIRSLVEEAFLNNVTVQWREPQIITEPVYGENGQFLKDKAKRISARLRQVAFGLVEIAEEPVGKK